MTYTHHTAVETRTKALKALGGAKVVIATAPNAKAIQALVGGIAPGGEVVIVAGSGEKMELSPVQLLGRLAVRGWVAEEGPRDIAETVRFSVLTQVQPLVETFPLEKASEAYARMMKADVRFRAVLKMV